MAVATKNLITQILSLYYFISTLVEFKKKNNLVKELPGV